MNPELLSTLRKWQASDDPVERVHARWRLSQPETLKDPKSALMPLSEALRLHRLMRQCPWRSTERCGCTGVRCGLRSAIVSNRDCLDCVRTYGVA
jgi:hypothetical protein